MIIMILHNSGGIISCPWRGQCMGLIHDIGIQHISDEDKRRGGGAMAQLGKKASKSRRLTLSTRARGINNRVEGDARTPCGSCRAFSEPTVSRRVGVLANSSMNICRRGEVRARLGKCFADRLSRMLHINLKDSAFGLRTSGSGLGDIGSCLGVGMWVCGWRAMDGVDVEAVVSFRFIFRQVNCRQGSVDARSPHVNCRYRSMVNFRIVFVVLLFRGRVRLMSLDNCGSLHSD